MIRRSRKMLRILPGSWPRARLSLPVALWGMLCLLLVSVSPLLHQSIVLGMAIFLRCVADSFAVRNLLTWLGFDPVYASVFNRTIGNIDAQGLAIAGPLGETLQGLSPEIFSPPDKAVSGAWVTALVGDGVSILASAMVIVAANAFFIVAGLVLMVRILPRRRSMQRVPFLALTFVSAMMQARGLVGLSRRSFTLEDLEIMGLS